MDYQRILVSIWKGIYGVDFIKMKEYVTWISFRFSGTDHSVVVARGVRAAPHILSRWIGASWWNKKKLVSEMCPCYMWYGMNEN